MATTGYTHIDSSTGKILQSERDNTGLLLAANNLSDVSSSSTALTNLGAQASDALTSGSYSTADINIGTTTDGAFADVDATNAKITFTVNVTGKWLLCFVFSENIAGSVGLAASSSTLFRLTDGSNPANAIQSGLALPASVGFAESITIPVTLQSVFNFTTTGSKTVKLQKQILSISNIATHTVEADSNSPLTMFAYRIAN